MAKKLGKTHSEDGVRVRRGITASGTKYEAAVDRLGRTSITAQPKGKNKPIIERYGKGGSNQKANQKVATYRNGQETIEYRSGGYITGPRLGKPQAKLPKTSKPTIKPSTKKK